MTNTAPTTGVVKGKTIKSDDQYQNECEKKQDESDDAQEELLTPGATKKNFTMASGGLLGEDSLKPAFSNQSYFSRTPEKFKRFLTGILPFQRKQGIPLCNGDSHPSGIMAGGHSEARIIGELGPKLAGKTLMINVNLQTPDGKLSKLPCRQCHALICKTMKSCNVTIIICDHDQNGVDMAQCCSENGQINKSNRKELVRLLGYRRL